MIKLTHTIDLKRWMGLLSTLLAVGMLFVGVSVAQAKTDDQQAGKHVLTVYDGGTELGILTDKATLGEALKEAGIDLNDNDIAEPSVDEELVTGSYRVNIYRARPVVVVDGDVVTKVMSPYSSVDKIAEQANIEMRDEDLAKLTSSPESLIGDGALERMVIDRATPFTLMLYGKKVDAYTQAATVGEMIKEKSIKLGSKDKLSLPVETEIVAGMTVDIYRDGKQAITVEEAIAKPIREIRDANREAGYREVKTPGADGTKQVTYEVIMKNGRELSRKEINSVTTKQPVGEVVIVGTKQSLPPGSHKDWMRAGGIAAGDFGYVNAIFSQESGWNPGATNPVGYYGLGQTSLDRLTNACGSGWASDPICQIRVFDQYAKGRYGSWEAAYEFKFGSPGQSGAGWW